MKHDLINPELFGNEAGEDENPEILDSYFHEKAEFDRFFSDTTRLQIVRSRKGVGKSALLRQALFKRHENYPDELHLYLKASDLVAIQDIDTTSPAALINGWQQRMCLRINLELGATLQFAASDDAMNLVERSELHGFRGRNLVGSLLDRLRLKAGGVEISRDRIAHGNSQELLRRIADSKDINVWIYIDDIDATFLSTESERLKASTFFSACRNLVSTVEGVNIRASVRTDVWTLLAQYDEALDKCEQYMMDLSWNTGESCRILENKISSYFQPNRPDMTLPSGEAILGLIMTERFKWGAQNVPAKRPLQILSAGRPRWVAQLCRLAGRHAFKQHRERIGMGDIRSIMGQFGRSRLSDLYKEHRHQCPTMVNIIEAFAGTSPEFTTKELIDVINNRIFSVTGMPEIDGIVAANDELTVAHFLFRVGLISAREDLGGALKFIRFEDRPQLLSTEQNPDDGLVWTVHPTYRSV